MSGLSESTVESAALSWLADTGWHTAHGPDIAPGTPDAERTDYGEVILAQRLRDSLARLNPDLPADALDDAFRKLTRPQGTTLEARNRAFHLMVVDGVTVEYRDAGGVVRGAQARVIDFDDPANNDWLAVNQFTVVENKHERRPDVVLFVNGLPLAVIELKNPADEEATIRTAWQQLQTYKAEIPSLFTFNAALVVSDGLEARIGTLTAGREWFKPWRTITGETLADPHMPQLQVMLEGVCEPATGSWRWSATSSCSRTTAAARWSRRWRAITSSTRCRVQRSPRPCAPPSCRGKRWAWPRKAGRYESGRKPGGEPRRPAYRWSSGTRRAPARA